MPLLMNGAIERAIQCKCVNFSSGKAVATFAPNSLFRVTGLGLQLSCHSPQTKYPPGGAVSYAFGRVQPVTEGDLLQQGQNTLRLLIGLSQHGGCSLLDDLGLGQLRGCRGVIRVHN